MTPHSADHTYTSGDYWSAHHDAESGYKAILIFKMLERMTLMPQGGHYTAIEIGCGTGTVLETAGKILDAKADSYELIGYDIASDAIQIATQRNQNPHIRFEVGGTDIPHRVDHIYIMDVAEHVENPYQLLRDLHGKSDYVFLHLPMEESISHWFTERGRNSYNEYSHIHFYSWQSAQILIEASGYEIADVQFTATSPVAHTLKGTRKIKLFRRVRSTAWRLLGKASPFIFGGPVLLALRPKKEVSSFSHRYSQ